MGESELLAGLQEERDWLEQECPGRLSLTRRLLDREIGRMEQGGALAREAEQPGEFLDIYNEKPVRLAARVTVPIKEHPQVPASQHNIARQSIISHLLFIQIPLDNLVEF